MPHLVVSGVIDAEARWQQSRRLLHDDTVKPEDRVAGLLILLYAQGPAAISRLTLDHIHADEHQVRLQFGHEPIVLPEPLAALVRDLIACRRGHAALGDQGTSPWLFPGGQPGRPISACQLGNRLRQLGLRPGQARSTALFGLTTELPAALLARMLDIDVAVAVAVANAPAAATGPTTPPTPAAATTTPNKPMMTTVAVRRDAIPRVAI